jgi:hypothetical protein
MQYEHAFSIAGNIARPLSVIDLAKAGFRERQHLEEWLIENPRVFGDDVLVVTSEFDRWQNSLGDPRKDRLDILAIDSNGRLVLVELKRDFAADGVDLQSLKYAALAARFTEDTLVEAHRKFLERRKRIPVTSDEARAHLVDHIGGQSLDPETWKQPRIILVANSYPDTVTNTVLWLSDVGLDIELFRYQAYSTGSEPLLIVNRMYPVPNTDELVLAPRREELQKAREKSRISQRQTDTVTVLIEADALPAGTQLHLDPTGINEVLRGHMSAWLAEDPRRGEATWTNVPNEPLLWHYTSERGKPTQFAAQALKEATGVSRSVYGTAWWRLDNGTSLAELARVQLGEREDDPAPPDLGAFEVPTDSD